MRLLFGCVVAAALLGQTAATPVAGIVLGGNGQLLCINGVLGNLLPGIPFGNQQGVVAAGFGMAGGLVKTADALLVLDAAGAVQSQIAAPPGAAVFGLDASGKPAYVYFPGGSRIESLTGGVDLDALPLGDEVVALGAPGTGGLPVLARTGSQLWAETVSPASGAILTQTPIDGSAPAVFFEGEWLVKGGPALLSGTREWALPAEVVTLQTAGPRSVAINGRWLLNGAGQLLEIPLVRRAHTETGPLPPGAARR